MTRERSEATWLERLAVRDFRTYERLDIELGAGVSVVSGSNGLGKTNLLEACAFALTGSSPRTTAEARCVRSGSAAMHLAAHVRRGDNEVDLGVGFGAGQAKRLTIDDYPAASLGAFAQQALVSVFLPERLLVVRGAPARRRGSLDRFVTRIDPAAGDLMRRYTHVVTQRNSVLRRAALECASSTNWPPGPSSSASSACRCVLPVITPWRALRALSRHDSSS